MILKCIAVDDEPLALGLISSFIAQTPFLQLEGSFSSAVEALGSLHNKAVDLVFLDIQMPDLNGMELARVINRTPIGHSPRIIFTTAFNQYALEGYKVNAIDYLLKPYSYEEFLEAAQKALALTEAFLATAPVSSKDLLEPFILIKSEYQLVKVALQDIIYIEGLKDYLKIFLENTEKPLLTQMTLKSMEMKLPSDLFLRIQRSFIIAPDKIKSITRNTVQIGDISIPVGDQYKDAFAQLLSRWM
ncbi:Two-component system response regulator [Arcticibacter svalbardensis MN12-7]|uniref:Two-component system response regulator n=1 Tax=Arcticibacter svalbardensis MN12-7 TaxID=1150600 RepID=R9GUW6_9SPHI|nr:LytTR family DNA-binding domain-containing protein [Arcticibacter svalbardensis]EOR95632.1 Two-component system response regulator [Arcticibacter svalbardensis MN12-7]